MTGEFISRKLWSPELVLIFRERLHQWDMSLLYKLSGIDFGLAIASLSLSHQHRFWKFACMEGPDSMNDLALWKKLAK